MGSRPYNVRIAVMPSAIVLGDGASAFMLAHCSSLSLYAPVVSLGVCGAASNASAELSTHPHDLLCE
jgi:hypothetical protein